MSLNWHLLSNRHFKKIDFLDNKFRMTSSHLTLEQISELITGDSLLNSTEVGFAEESKARLNSLLVKIKNHGYKFTNIGLNKNEVGFAHMCGSIIYAEELNSLLRTSNKHIIFALWENTTTTLDTIYDLPFNKVVQIIQASEKQQLFANVPTFSNMVILDKIDLGKVKMLIDIASIINS
jgi:hypothetical protein